MSRGKDPNPSQLLLPLDFTTPRAPPARVAQVPALRLIRGGGQRKRDPLASRDAVIRVLVEAGADLLLRRISSVRAEEIEGRVDKVLSLFDRVDVTPALMPVLQRQLEELEVLMQETRSLPTRRRG